MDEDVIEEREKIVSKAKARIIELIKLIAVEKGEELDFNTLDLDDREVALSVLGRLVNLGVDLGACREVIKQFLLSRYERLSR